MKRTYTANVSGQIFNIDEDAYDRLNKYLQSLNNYFSNSEGKDEILQDIELRIAEMFQNKLTPARQVITIEDVEEVIKTMGETNQIDTETTENNNNQPKQETIYNTESTKRKLYRDPDEKILGGVCSGIAAYFDWETVWVRLGFVIAALLFGTSILIYLILWIIIPKARTTAEKLEMRGEKVNISNIEKTIKEEMNDLKNKFKDFSEEAKERYHTGKKNFNKNEASDKVGSFFKTVFYYMFKSIMVFFGIILVIIGVSLLISLLVGIFGTGDHFSFNDVNVQNISFTSFMDSLFQNSGYITLGIVSFIAILAIPLIMLIYNGLKILIGFKSNYKIIGISVFGLWLIACLTFAFSVYNLGSNFSQKSVLTNRIEISQPINNNLHVILDKTSRGYNEISQMSDNSWKMFQCYVTNINDKNILFGTPEIKIMPSEGKNYEIVILKSARGKDRKEASENANKITYSIQQNDSLLTFQNYFNVPDNEKWRNQRIKVLIKVPEGKTITFDNDFSELIDYSESYDFEWDYNLFNKNTFIMHNYQLKLGNKIVKSVTEEVKK